MKITIFHNNEHTYVIISESNLTPKEYIENIKHIWNIITSQYLSSKNNKVTNSTLYDIHSTEQSLPHYMHTKLAQLTANKSPFFQSYLHKLNLDTYTPLVISKSHIKF